MGQTLVNDSSICAEVDIETYSMRETDGPVTRDNRTTNTASLEDLEAAATARALARNVNRITFNDIKTKILDTSRRHHDAFIQEQAERQAAGLDVISSVFSSTTTTTPSSSDVAPIITGVGRDL